MKILLLDNKYRNLKKKSKTNSAINSWRQSSAVKYIILYLFDTGILIKITKTLTLQTLI